MMKSRIWSSLVTLGPGADSRIKIGCMASVSKKERARLNAWNLMSTNVHVLGAHSPPFLELLFGCLKHQAFSVWPDRYRAHYMRLTESQHYPGDTLQCKRKLCCRVLVVCRRVNSRLGLRHPKDNSYKGWVHATASEV